jgi:ketosteroid isomerase-like protein
MVRERTEARSRVGSMVRDVGEDQVGLDEGLRVTRSWFETWNRGDLDGFMALYAVDAEMTPPASWVESGTIVGQAAIRRFFEGLKEAWEGEDTAVMRELFRAGEEVVSRMEWHVRGRTSGIDTQLGISNVNTIVNGKIVRQRHFLDHAEALEALGSAGDGLRS